MKKSVQYAAGLLACAALLSGCATTGASSTKTTSAAKKGGIQTATVQDRQRTVITTDGEVDDMNSVLRALLYANEMDIAGIVITSSMYHYAGDAEKGIEPFRWTGTDWIWKFLDDYETVYPNLITHADGYPTADSLRAVTKIGNISNKGEMEQVTEGSEFLKELFLDDDPRTLYVQTWGGTNTTARALKSIEESYAGTPEWQSVQDKINAKVVLYIILDQDESYAQYIAKSWPGITILNDRSNFWHFAYAWQYHSDELNSRLKGEWTYPNLVQDKGALMANYALMGDGDWLDGELPEEQRGSDAYMAANPNYQQYDFISEGDSPSFLYLIDTGLRSLEDPSFGGWGGRFGAVQSAAGTVYNNSVLDYDPYTGQYEAQYTLSRWFDVLQEDFAARADWCVLDKKAANHNPSVSVVQGIDVSAAPGETVTLTASGTDPDGDSLSYQWWRYAEADTYQDIADPEPDVDFRVGGDDGMLLNVTRALAADETPAGNIALSGADTETVTFTVPEDARPGDTIHLVVTVTDDGAHNLVHYQRVIVTVR